MISRNVHWRWSACAAFFLTSASAHAWDEPGHVLVTRLAVEALPPEYPDWVKSPENVRRLCYLAAEPDRWRGQHSAVLDHINGPDHYLDAEDLADYRMRLDALPRFRNEFIEQIAVYRAAHPDVHPMNPNGDRDHTHSVPGLLPYAIEENRWKLTSSWSTLRTFEKNRDAATPDELAAARNDVLQCMGILSHYVGDASQPLHMTKHHNGWVGNNPMNYTRSRGLHVFVDGDSLIVNEITFDSLRPRLLPAATFDPQDDWAQVLAYLGRSWSNVERLYRFEQARGLRDSAGKRFLEDCLLSGEANLSGLWVAAWRASVIDEYLQNKLLRRQAEGTVPATTQSTTSSPTSQAR